MQKLLATPRHYIYKTIVLSQFLLGLFLTATNPIHAATLTVNQSNPTNISVDDGTRMICFGQGPASSARSFWQPVDIKHDTIGGNPTSCTSGGDSLISTANGNFDALLYANTAIVDNDSDNLLNILEVLPSRFVVQTYKNDTRDHYSKTTVYPNGYIFSFYNLGTITANDNALLGEHYNTTTPEIFNRNSTYHTHTIADTSNNNYAGLSVVPFRLLTIPNLDTAYQNAGNDVNGWIGSNTAPIGNIRNDTGWLLNFDFSTYRATTTTTDTRRTDFQSPDVISSGMSNGILWDDSGEQSLFWTGFENGLASLCLGGDGWDTALCNADDGIATFGGSDKYLGSYGAQFDGGATGTDVAYVEETLDTAPRYTLRAAFKIANETLGNSQAAVVARLLGGGGTIADLQLYQDGSGNIKLCTNTTTQTCGTSNLSTGVWYQVEYSVLVNTGSDYGSRAELWINGTSEAIDTSSTGTTLIDQLRLGLVTTATAENIVDFDNVAINKTEIGIIGFNPDEGAYSMQSSWNNDDLSFDLDRSGYSASGAVFKIRNWRSLYEPVRIYLEGTEKTDGTHYNMDILPISEAWVYDSDTTCGASGWKKLAEGGDTSISDEYLADSTADFDFGGTDNCIWGDSNTDAIYFGRTDRISGLNIQLATKGVGSPTVTWEYCSANTDISSSCDTWSSLTVTDTHTGASTLKQSGNFYFTPPSQWKRSSESSDARGLYFMRGRVTAGSYTTYPVEDTIKSDILLLQSLETITTDNQTFTLDTFDPSVTFTVTGIGANTVNNGITTSVASTYNLLPFGSLSVNSPKYLAHQLELDANTPGGFTVYVQLESFLQGNYPANNVDPFAAVGATWATPVVWSSPTGTTANINTSWIGANTSDTNVSGWSNGSGKFGPVEETNHTVMYSSREIIDGTTAVVTYAIESNLYQPADMYSGIIQYTVLPIY